MAATFEDALRQIIRTTPLTVSIYNLTTKWWLQLKGGYVLDVYFNVSGPKYSYTLTKDERRVLGWDNAPHHPGLVNFPHHFHGADGSVTSSSLDGDPQHDLEVIFVEIEQFLKDR